MEELPHIPPSIAGRYQCRGPSCLFPCRRQGTNNITPDLAHLPLLVFSGPPLFPSSSLTKREVPFHSSLMDFPPRSS